MATTAFYQTIRDELDNDPLARGYAGMTDQQATDSLNTEDRSVDRETMSASEIFEAIEVAEWQALTADQKNQVEKVIQLGDNIQIGTGTKARAFLADAFGPATTTRATLLSLAQETISRAQELGLGTLVIGDIQNARAL